jgi:hypothetical protein
MEIDLPEKSTIYGDKAYNDYGFEDLLHDAYDLRLIAERKVNSKRQHSGCMHYLQGKLRKKIETSFSSLTRLFPRKIEAVTAKGFIMKLLIFICSFSIQQLL